MRRIGDPLSEPSASPASMPPASRSMIWLVPLRSTARIASDRSDTSAPSFTARHFRIVRALRVQPVAPVRHQALGARAGLMLEQVVEVREIAVEIRLEQRFAECLFRAEVMVEQRFGMPAAARISFRPTAETLVGMIGLAIFRMCWRTSAPEDAFMMAYVSND